MNINNKHSIGESVYTVMVANDGTLVPACSTICRISIISSDGDYCYEVSMPNLSRNVCDEEDIYILKDDCQIYCDRRNQTRQILFNTIVEKLLQNIRAQIEG